MKPTRFVFAALVLGIAAFLAACSTASPTSSPPTAAPVATSAPVIQPTTAPAATNAPGATNDGAPTNVPASATAAPSGGGSSGSLPASFADAGNKIYSFSVVPDQTTAEYAVNEVLFGNKRITKGSTNSVEGDFKLGVKNGVPFFDFSKMRVDLRTLQSDNRMRDQAIHFQWLESDQYPYADFTVTEVKNFPTDAQVGQDLKFQVTGDMTIRNITKPVTFDVTVKVDGDTLTGTGTTQIFMKDYGFDPPEIAGRFIVSDPATITVTGVAKYNPDAS